MTEKTYNIKITETERLLRIDEIEKSEAFRIYTLVQEGQRLAEEREAYLSLENNNAQGKTQKQQAPVQQVQQQAPVQQVQQQPQAQPAYNPYASQ